MPPARLTYRGIADDLAERIRIGEYAAGDRLPSIAALAGIYTVSRATVIRALGLLHDRGLIVGQAGVGVFVSSSPPM